MERKGERENPSHLLRTEAGMQIDPYNQMWEATFTKFFLGGSISLGKNNDKAPQLR